LPFKSLKHSDFVRDLRNDINLLYFGLITDRNALYRFNLWYNST